MKINELIENLSLLPQDAEVVVMHDINAWSKVEELHFDNVNKILRLEGDCETVGNDEENFSWDRIFTEKAAKISECLKKYNIEIKDRTENKLTVILPKDLFLRGNLELKILNELSDIVDTEEETFFFECDCPDPETKEWGLYLIQ